MYKGKKVILIAPAYNEELKIGEVVRRAPRDVVDKVLVVDDGSTDGTADAARSKGAEVLSLGAVLGVGSAIRKGYEIARKEGFDIAVVIAGNNKDSPEEIPQLIDPICDLDYDFVMGSRYLEGGQFGGEMPLYRKFATRLHPRLVGFFCRKKITESTNGFRAIKVSVLSDPKLNLNQSWLDRYELEVYLLMKLLLCGFKTTEVPCSKIYPPKKIGQTKMKPGIDWWRILRPVFLIGLGLKK
jgi:dolichol-phosphate mannosyltransferase